MVNIFCLASRAFCLLTYIKQNIPAPVRRDDTSNVLQKLCGEPAVFQMPRDWCAFLVHKHGVPRASFETGLDARQFPARSGAGAIAKNVRHMYGIVRKRRAAGNIVCATGLAPSLQKAAG
jgi:hypothetical protein